MAIKIIKEVTVKDLKKFLYKINLSDENLYREANNPNMIGVFQLTSDTSSKILKEVRPKNFDEICAISSLARPGTIEFVPDYIKNKETGSSKYPEIISDLLKETHSVVLYQEQIMSIFNKIGGFSLDRTNYIRGLMKKLGKKEKKQEDVDAWNKEVEKFKEGARLKGLTDRESDEVADDLLRLSSYSFNKSHAVAYSYIGMMNLYLSYYFRKYYYSSVLSYEVDRDKSIGDVFKLVKEQGFIVNPPDVNNSDYKIFPTDANRELVYGLIDIKGVGEKAIPSIIENRPYKDLFDFYIKTQGKGVNATVIKSLICSGAFDFYDKNRKKLLEVFIDFSEKKKSKKDPATLFSIFKECEKEKADVVTTNEDLIEYEKTFLGANIFTSLFNEKMNKVFLEMEEKSLIKTNLEKVTIGASRVPVIITRKHELNDKNGNPMCFIEFEDMHGNRDSVPIFSSYFKFLEPFEVNCVYLISLYRKEGKIMFGTSKYEDREEPIKRFVKKIKGD